ncbi:MAG: S41 family peptidase, partial [Chloroflexi bacterium]|nr:S41 family peptidase [Chloroflexota bacterium]
RMNRNLRTAMLLAAAVVALCAVFSAGFITGTIAGDQGIQARDQFAGAVAPELPADVDADQDPRPMAFPTADARPETPAEFDDVDFALFWEAWSVIQDHFYGGPLDPEVLREGAIRGLAEATEDQHTVYQNSEEAERSRERIRGSFVGVGIRIELRDETPFVLTPLPNSPAERAGIRANEFVVAVDGVSTRGMALDEFGRRVRGEEGTSVVLTMQPEGSEETRDVSVERARVLVPSVTKDRFDEIGYVRIANFGSRTSKELSEALDELEAEGISALVLDLRNNPGGLLDASVRVAAQFLARGQTILIQEHRHEGRTRWRVQDEGGDTTTPILVLVNGGSASASEIVAGALQAHGRAQLMGEETFGKGSMQELHQLSDESIMRVTSGIWITPNDVNLNDSGLTPDVPHESSDGPYGGEDDALLQEALRRLDADRIPDVDPK